MQLARSVVGGGHAAYGRVSAGRFEYGATSSLGSG